MNPTRWIAMLIAVSAGCVATNRPGPVGPGPVPPPVAYVPPIPPIPPNVPRPAPADMTRDFPTVPRSTWFPLTQGFEQQARGLPVPQWDAIWKQYLAHPAIPVRVAVIDVVPDKEGPPIRFAHREAVKGVIRSLSCATDAADCAARINEAPATGATTSSLNRDAGSNGQYLTFVQIRDSLSAVLQQWHPADEHLVINFAVAWDPIKTGANSPASNDSIAGPILHLLKRASCMGAAVIAPAGNITGSVGPMLPAGYEALAAPTDEECAALNSPRGIKNRDTRPPLVYAVGALDARDNRVVTSRQWGLPRMAAYSTSVTSPRPNASPYIFSGTSMSTGIVSGVAAAVWAAQPKLSADKVMQIVYDGGVVIDPERRTDDSSRRYPGYYASTHTQSEFCLGHISGPCHDLVHRVSLCGALAKALPDARLQCDMQPTGHDRRPPTPAYTPTRYEKPAVPCTTTKCGQPVPAMADQIPYGAVPQPGISGCIGCLLNLPGRFAHIKLERTSYYMPWMYAATVQGYDSDLRNPSMNMAAWSVDSEVDIPMIGLPGNTWGAMLTVSYYDYDDGKYKSASFSLEIK